jgi:hemoglobin/transferrin/lactoferrin receptor protein
VAQNDKNSRRGWGTRATIWIAIAVVPALAFAGQAADPAQSVVEEVVVVGARLPRPVQEVAASVDVITHEALRETLAVRAADVVRYTPGVSVAGAGTRFGDAEFTIRGLSGNRVLTLIDGVPVADQFDIGDFSNATQDYLVPDAISRVEILRGPASALFGSDALGGVVAVLTRDPEEYLARASSNVATSALYDGADDSRVLTGSIAGRAGDSTAVVYLSTLEGEELDHAADGPTDRIDRERDAVLAKASHSLGDGDRLRLRADLFDERVESGIESVLGYGRRYVNTTSMRGDDRRERYSFGVGYDFARGRLDDGRLDVYYASTRVEQMTHELREIARPPVAIEREFDYEQDVAGLSADFERRFDMGEVSHRVNWGVTGSRREVEEYRNGLETNLSTGSTTNVLLGEVMPVRDFPDSTIDAWGVYLLDEIAIGRVSLIPALRFDDYSMDADADARYLEDNPATAVVDLDETSLSPKLGLIYRSTEELSLFVQYARGFRAPPFEDVNIGLDIPRFNIRAIPNPDLEPEESQGLELGGRFANGALRASAAVFGVDYEDFIESKVNLGPDPDTGVLIFQSRNVARARVYGVEFEVDVDLDEWLTGVSLGAAANLTRGDNRETDEPLNSIDPAELIVRARWTANDRLRFALVATAVDGQDRVDETTIDLFTPDSFVTLDAFATFEPTSRVRVDVGVFNVFDDTHWRWAAVRGRPVDDPVIGALSAPGRYGSVAVHVAL